MPTTAIPHTVYKASEGKKFNADTTLVVVECYTCKILYAIPESLDSAARKWKGDSPRGWNLCCPLGHTWYYTGSNPEQDLRKERKRARDLEESLNHERDRSGRLAADLGQTTASLRAQKGATTRVKRERDQIKERTAAGVCPAGCKRHFVNLERHMTTKHPDFKETE